ncbi:MAG: hypothetical protein FWF77_10180 [Defluviitaleaceae bacterium]|nr:hypothetical protein [Defluviitaleaceae bacterium]
MDKRGDLVIFDDDTYMYQKVGESFADFENRMAKLDCERALAMTDEENALVEETMRELDMVTV